MLPVRYLSPNNNWTSGQATNFPHSHTPASTSASTSHQSVQKPTEKSTKNFFWRRRELFLPPPGFHASASLPGRRLRTHQQTPTCSKTHRTADLRAGGLVLKAANDELTSGDRTRAGGFFPQWELAPRQTNGRRIQTWLQFEYRKSKTQNFTHNNSPQTLGCHGGVAASSEGVHTFRRTGNGGVSLHRLFCEGICLFQVIYVCVLWP